MEVASFKTSLIKVSKCGVGTGSPDMLGERFFGIHICETTSFPSNIRLVPWNKPYFIKKTYPLLYCILLLAHFIDAYYGRRGSILRGIRTSSYLFEQKPSQPACEALSLFQRPALARASFSIYEHHLGLNNLAARKQFQSSRGRVTWCAR